jgi:hypothetical protein
MDLGYPRPRTPSERQLRDIGMFEPPDLPSMSPAARRRWATSATWTPPSTKLLVRHRAVDGRGWRVSNDRTPPAGFELEFDLGQVQRFGQLGTSLLLAKEGADGGDEAYLRLTVDESAAPGFRSLGYVEDAPFPMLNALELRRDAASGAALLVSGVDDPRYETTIPERVLGFLESYPIEPRHPPDERVDLATRVLCRHADETDWRHRYYTSDQASEQAVALGTLWDRPGPDFVGLNRNREGWLWSELTGEPTVGEVSIGAKLRWSAAPLTWPEHGPTGWATRATLSRARAVVRHARMSRAITGSAMLGYVRREPARGWSPIFAAVHPAIHDQYVTRSELEAGDMGYRIEGVLGYVLDLHADRRERAFSREVKWASRFGQRRRFVEGRMPV